MIAWLCTFGSHWFPGHVLSVHVACIRGVPFMLISIANFFVFYILQKKPSEIWQIRHFRSCNRSKTSSFSLLCFLIRLYFYQNCWYLTFQKMNSLRLYFITGNWWNVNDVRPCTFLFLTCLSLNSVILNVSFFIFKSQNLCVGLFSDWKITVKLNISPVLLTLA